MCALTTQPRNVVSYEYRGGADTEEVVVYCTRGDVVWGRILEAAHSP
jgi:hypothetical protein